MDDFINPVTGKLIDSDAPTLLIDGDILCYSASAAADGRAYRVLDGSFGDRPVFKTAQEANEFLASRGLSHHLWRETTFLPDPVENCLHSLKLMVKSMLEGTGSSSYRIYLTGEDNFRFKIHKDYKANRTGVRRPEHLPACREYLLKNYDTVLVHGVEADDALGIDQMSAGPLKTAICSKDKDLLMIPGLHWRWDNDNNFHLINQTPTEAFRCFFRQLITGDPTDNIDGLSEKAPKKRTFPIKPLDELDDPLEMLRYVIPGYLQKYQGDVEAAKKFMKRDANLLWILRECDFRSEETAEGYSVRYYAHSIRET